MNNTNANDDKNKEKKLENNDDSNQNNRSSIINENKPAIRILYRFSSISREPPPPPPSSNIFIPPKLKTLQELRAISKVPNYMGTKHLLCKSNNLLSNSISLPFTVKKLEEIPKITITNASPQKMAAPLVETTTGNLNTQTVYDKLSVNETKQENMILKKPASEELPSNEEFMHISVPVPTTTTIPINEAENHNFIEKKENLKAEIVDTPKVVSNMEVYVENAIFMENSSDVQIVETLFKDNAVGTVAQNIENVVQDIGIETICSAVEEKPVADLTHGENCELIETINFTENEEAKQIDNKFDNTNKGIDKDDSLHSTIEEIEQQTEKQEKIEEIEENEISIEKPENSLSEIENELIDNNTQHVDNNINIMQHSACDENVAVETIHEDVAMEQQVDDNFAVETLLKIENAPVEKIHIIDDVEIIPETIETTIVEETPTNTKLLDNEIDTLQQLVDVNCDNAIEKTEHLQYHISYFNKSDVTAQRHPLKSENGEVLHIFFELDVLIVVQQLSISFLKYSKLMNVLKTSATTSVDIGACYNNENEWLLLDQCQRLINDIEISVAYSNRMCINNSIPVYLEMRGGFRPPESGRLCPLLSLYVNVYYYHDEEMHSKIHSVNLDTVQSLSEEVTFTTIPDSRYFIMCWSQVGHTKKRKTGMVKYSLTPQLDTLASIREFKDMRHPIKLLECINDDKLLGFGETQITIWDHRSGDVLMNYDFEMKLGRNVGSIYYPSVELGQNNMIVLFQYISTPTMQPHISKHELLLLICSVSHVAPTYRLLKRFDLPQPAFNAGLLRSENNGEHIVLTANYTDVELWISCANPNTMLLLPAQNSQRFYVRGRTQIIELTEHTLTVDNIANHLLKLNAIENSVNGITT